jgi:hypothetical protein
LPPKARKRRRRVVVDTSVLVAGVPGFKETYVPGKTPSADVLYEWAEGHSFVWLVSDTSWTSTRRFSSDFMFVPT